jgi:hypothetical protein
MYQNPLEVTIILFFAWTVTQGTKFIRRILICGCTFILNIYYRFFGSELNTEWIHESFASGICN